MLCNFVEAKEGKVVDVSVKERRLLLFQVVIDITDVILACCTCEDDQVGMLALHQINSGIGICRVVDSAEDGLGMVVKGGHTGIVQVKVFFSGEGVVGWRGHDNC
eukprot:12049484-Ditylum_brightwellii.AAC.1